MDIKKIAKQYGFKESDLSKNPDGSIDWTCEHGVRHPVGQFKGSRREHRCDCHCCILQVI